jgi:proteic killer suppression protein
MIHSFRHKGLSRYFERSETKGLQPAHVARIGRILDTLDAAERIEDMEIPDFGLHLLKGDKKGRWAVSVSGNWRITFGFADGEAIDIDLEDYH